MLVRRTNEGHDPVARRPVDGDAGAHQPVAQRIDIVDLVGEVAEIARLAVIFAVPVVRQLDEGSVAAR